MTVTAGPLRVGAATPTLRAVLARQEWVDRRVTLTWYFLVLNALTYFSGLSVLRIPGSIGKLVTQGSLFIAFTLALTVNRKLVIRPNVFLSLVTVMVIGTVVACLQPETVGTIYRTFRLIIYVVTLWLLTPWWGRRDLLLIRAHLKALSAVMVSAAIGIFVDPPRAFGAGRLSGIIWPVPPPQLAHYSATVMGLIIVLWMCGQVRGRTTAYVAIGAGTLLILTHTRTALLGMIVALIVAGLSLIVAKPRVRKLFTVAATTATIVILTASEFITRWLARGEGTGQLSNLTGRTVVWSALVNSPRNKFQEIFGFGLSNDSFGGLPIDSNWLASYQSQGYFGVTICGIILLFLMITSCFQPRGRERALALFITTYCLVASFTEVGFTNATIYLLELSLAASLVVSSRYMSTS